jgi:phosphoribosylamine-glycine ligase
MPNPEFGDKYGAEIVFTNDFYDSHEICFEYSKEIDENVKLKNCTKRGKAHYCVPNGNGIYPGSCVATGKTVKEATEKCLAIAEQITCDDLEYRRDVFDRAQEAVEAGRKFGIEF